MKIFRNKEYRNELILDAAFASAFAAFGFFMSPKAGAVTLGLGLLLLVLHGVFLYKRQNRLAALSDELDRILHGTQQSLISEQTEGELSILQSELRKMTARLSEQADQLLSDKRQLSEAIEDIFHQLRTPLTSMNLSVEMLRSPALSEEKRLQITRDLKRSLERIRWQVETLLKISKIDAKTALFRKDPVSVSALVRMAAEDLLIPMELRNQRFTADVGDAHFTGDLRWTSEALANLLKNAMEHTDEGGSITVRAAESPIYTEITVSDNGPGFPPEDIPYLFDRFFRGTNSSEESIGIGLALARMIITEQNGTITAVNRPEGGAVFTIRFYKSVV